MLDIQSIVSSVIDEVIANRPPQNSARATGKRVVSRTDEYKQRTIAFGAGDVRQMDLRINAIRTAKADYINAHNQHFANVTFGRVKGLGMWEVIADGRFVGAFYAHKVTIEQDNGLFVVRQSQS